jgi:penicillin-binding protein 2
MFHSDKKKQTSIQQRRAFLLLLSKFSIFSIIGWKLFDIQILDSKKYKTLSKNNQINVEILYPLRGDIFDRNMKLIASNKKVYDLYVVPEQSDNLMKTLNDLSSFISLDYQTKKNVIKLSNKLKKFKSIKVLENLNWNDLEIIEANKNYLQGLSLKTDYQRIYPYEKYFSHILGYVSQPTQKDLILPYIAKTPRLDIGKTSLEKFFNKDLVGAYGRKEIEVNSSGKTIREISRKPSKKGKKIKITIDERLQRFTVNELDNHKAGSIVVIEINTGEILSMASTPSFDPNSIIQKPNTEYWNSLINNNLSPLTNRSIQGLYSPGSTFKMIVALAALSENIINTESNNFCEGKIDFGDSVYHCWKTKGHGLMNIESALKESCDVFFYELAKKVGINKIAAMAHKFGLGQLYNIGFDTEKKGIIPSKKWKKETLKKKWYGGETLNAAIGQGYVLTNPMQLAIMTARIASKGKKIEPTILSNKVKEFEKIKDISRYLKIIDKALFKVVNDYKGTAFRSKSNEYLFSGKTGTSQVKRISLLERESDDFRKKEIEWKNKDHALFVGYMPSDKPKYAISVVIEHGGSGAATAAPIAKKIFDYLHKIKI